VLFTVKDHTTRRFSVPKSIVVAAVLVAGASGVAYADDNSISRFGGDGYTNFNEGDAIASKAPSGFRQSSPNGLSLRQYQALSSNSSLWQVPAQPQTTATASTNAADVAKTVAKRPMEERTVKDSVSKRE
jgi:hypothetical protein